MFLLQSATLHDVPDAELRDSEGSSSGIVQYMFIREHPILRFLPSKWAEFIGDNYADELRLPVAELQDRNLWTVAGLNYILTHVLVGELLVFGAIEHESELFEGTPRIKCYPFSSHKHHGKNPQVNLLL